MTKVSDVNEPMGAREVGDMSTKVKEEDSVVESEKMSWKDQRLKCSGRSYREIKKSIRYLDEDSCH